MDGGVAYLEHTLATDLLEYAREQDGITRSDGQGAGVTLRQALADQYAVAADHNRRINLTRTRQRTAAGLFTLGSLLAMLLLVAVISWHYIRDHHAVG